MIRKWTEADHDKVAELLTAGKLASEIGAVIGVSRNAIIGIVGRTERLRAIGFARTPGHPGSRKPRPNRKQPVAGSHRKRPQKLFAAPKTATNPAHNYRDFSPMRTGFALPSQQRRDTITVPVTDLNSAIEQWMAANNGPRRFERGDSGDFFSVQEYLRARGHDVRGSPMSKGFTVISDGKKRSMGWHGILRLADEFRASEGRQTIFSRHQHEAERNQT
jgi:hypothetical protein